MLEKQLSSIIAQHLSKFLRNVPTEQLNVSLWEGEVALENVELQEDIFDQLSLLMWRTSTGGDLRRAADAELASLLMPFTVVKGIVRRLRISLPWSALESEPVSVEVEGVEVVLAPLRQRPYSASEEEKRNAAIKEVQLAAFEKSRCRGHGSGKTTGSSTESTDTTKEANGHHSTANNNNNGSPKGPAVSPSSTVGATVTGIASSFLDRLVATIIRNVQLTVKDVSVAFDFDYKGLHPSLATRLALRIDEIAVVPTDSAWRPRFIHTTSVAQCRLVHAGGISLTAYKARNHSNSTSGSVNGTWSSTTPLIEKFDVQIKMVAPPEHTDRANDPVNVSVSSSPIVINATPTALHTVMESINAFTKSLQYAQYRPFLPLLEEAIRKEEEEEDPKEGHHTTSSSSSSKTGAGGSDDKSSCMYSSSISPRSRWAFAIAAITSQLRQRHEAGKGIGKFLAIKSIYVGLFKRSEGVAWLPPLAPEEAAKQKSLEEQLTFDQIVFLRCLAKVELEEEARYIEADRRQLYKRVSMHNTEADARIAVGSPSSGASEANQQPQPRRSLWTGWWRGGGGGGSGTSSQPTIVATTPPPPADGGENFVEGDRRGKSEERRETLSAEETRLAMRRRVAESLVRELDRIGFSSPALSSSSPNKTVSDRDVQKAEVRDKGKSVNKTAPPSAIAAQSTEADVEAATASSRPYSLMVELPLVSCRVTLPRTHQRAKYVVRDPRLGSDSLSSEEGTGSGIVVSASNIVASTLIGAGEGQPASSRKGSQLEIGGITVRLLKSGRKIIQIQQTSNPCIVIGCNSTLTNIHAALGVCEVCVPPTAEIGAMLEGFSALGTVLALNNSGGSESSVNSSSAPTGHVRKGVEKADDSTVLTAAEPRGGGFLRRTLRFSMRQIVVCIGAPETNSVLVAEASQFDACLEQFIPSAASSITASSSGIDTIENGQSSFTFVVETVSNIDVSTPNSKYPTSAQPLFAGLRLFLARRSTFSVGELNGSGSELALSYVLDETCPFTVEAVGLRLSCHDNGLDLACGAISGHWHSSEALFPIVSIARDYSSSFSNMTVKQPQREACPSHSSPSDRPPKPQVIQKKTAGPSSGGGAADLVYTTRAAIYSFEFIYLLSGAGAKDEGMSMTGVPQQGREASPPSSSSGVAATDNGLSPWLYAQISTRDEEIEGSCLGHAELRCEGLYCSPLSSSWSHASSHIGVLHATKDSRGALFVSLGGGRLAACPLWAEFAEVATAISAACCPEAVLDSSDLADSATSNANHSTPPKDQTPNTSVLPNARFELTSPLFVVLCEESTPTTNLAELTIYELSAAVTSSDAVNPRGSISMHTRIGASLGGVEMFVSPVSLRVTTQPPTEGHHAADGPQTLTVRFDPIVYNHRHTIVLSAIESISSSELSLRLAKLGNITGVDEHSNITYAEDDADAERSKADSSTAAPTAFPPPPFLIDAGIALVTIKVQGGEGDPCLSSLALRLQNVALRTDIIMLPVADGTGAGIAATTTTLVSVDEVELSAPDAFETPLQLLSNVTMTLVSNATERSGSAASYSHSGQGEIRGESLSSLLVTAHGSGFVAMDVGTFYPIALSFAQYVALTRTLLSSIAPNPNDVQNASLNDRKSGRNKTEGNSSADEMERVAIRRRREECSQSVQKMTFVFSTRQTLALSIGIHAPQPQPDSAIEVSLDGFALRLVSASGYFDGGCDHTTRSGCESKGPEEQESEGCSSSIEVKSAESEFSIDLGTIRMTDNTRRRLLVPSLRADDPRQAQSPSTLAARMPIVTVTAVRLSALSTTYCNLCESESTRTATETNIAVDNVFVTCLFESFRLLKDSLLPDDLTPWLAPSTPPLTKIQPAVAAERESSAPPSLSTENTKEPTYYSSSTTNITVAHTSVFIYEAWLARVGTVLVPSLATKVESFSDGRAVTTIAVKDISVTADADGSEDGTIVLLSPPDESDPSQALNLMLKIESDAPPKNTTAETEGSTIAGVFPSLSGLVSIEANNVRVVVHPSLLKLTNAAMSQLLPLSELVEMPSRRREARLAPLRFVPRIAMHVRNTVIDVAQTSQPPVLPSSTANFVPAFLRIAIGETKASNALTRKVVDGVFLTWSDDLLITLSNMIFPVGFIIDRVVDDSLRLTLSRPLPLATSRLDTASWMDFTELLVASPLTSPTAPSHSQQAEGQYPLHGRTQSQTAHVVVGGGSFAHSRTASARLAGVATPPPPPPLSPSSYAIVPPINEPYIVFESVIKLEAKFVVKVSQSSLAAVLRIAELMGSVPTYPAAMRPKAEHYIPILSVVRLCVGETRVELVDTALLSLSSSAPASSISSADRETVLAIVLPHHTEVTSFIDTLETKVVLRGGLLVGDATGMAIVKGTSVAVDVTAHPTAGASAMVGGVTLILDLKRAHALIRVLNVANAIMPATPTAVGQAGVQTSALPSTIAPVPQKGSLARVHVGGVEGDRESIEDDVAADAAVHHNNPCTSPDALHDTLVSQQQSLKPAPPPFRLGVQSFCVEVAHIARVVVCKASVTLLATGSVSVLMDEASISDRRGAGEAEPRRVFSVSHVNVASSVGDVRVGIHSATVYNDALFFTDLATALLQAYRSVMPKLKISPKQDESFKQSMTVEMRSCSVVFRTFLDESSSNFTAASTSTSSARSPREEREKEASRVGGQVDVTFPGLVVKTTQSTEGVSLVVDAVDGSMGFLAGGHKNGASHTTCNNRQPLCQDIRFRLETASTALEDTTRLTLGNVSVSAPIGSSLKAIVSVMAESLTPYALWGKMLMRGGGGGGGGVSVAAPTSPNTLSSLTRSRSVLVEVPSFSVSLCESNTINVPSCNNRSQPFQAAAALPPSSTNIISVRMSELLFSSSVSPDSERVELHIGSIVSETDRTIQPDFLRALPVVSGVDRDATSNYGVFVRLHRSFDFSGSKASSVIRWGSAAFVLSPQLIRLLDDYVLRPAGMGIREATSKKESYALNESFTTVSSADMATAESGLIVITSDYTFTSDVVIGGNDGAQLHISRADGRAPNVVYLRAAEGVTVHLHPSVVRPIVVDEGMSVYCQHGMRFTCDPHFTHVLDYVHCGERSFFNVQHGGIVARSSASAPEADAVFNGGGAHHQLPPQPHNNASMSSAASYAVLSSGLKCQRLHSVSLSVRGQTLMMLCNNRDSFSISSEVEAEYMVTRRSDGVIVEEKGFFGMPTLSVQCNDGEISKRPITLITHLQLLTNAEAVDTGGGGNAGVASKKEAAAEDGGKGRSSTTNVHVILDKTTIALTLDHAKLFYDTIGAVLPLVTRVGTLGSEIEDMTATDDPFAAVRMDAMLVTSGHAVCPTASSSSARQGSGTEGQGRQRLNVIINAPSLQFELVDPSMRRIGWGGIDSLAVQVSGTRDLSSLAVKGSCSMRMVDLPYAYGGERVLLDVNPEIVVDVGSLGAGGSKCEVAIAVPPLTVNLPLLKLMAAASYEFMAPARGPYTISNDTDLHIRMDIGDMPYDLEESSAFQATIEPTTRVRIALKELTTPIILDLRNERTEVRLPFIPTSTNALVIAVSHFSRQIRVSTGVTIVSYLSGVSDPLLALHWGDAFGFIRKLECPPNAPVVLPFAVGAKPLRLFEAEYGVGEEGGVSSSLLASAAVSAALPIEVLCGMARAAFFSNKTKKKGQAPMRTMRFKASIGGDKWVVVNVRVVEPVTRSDFPDVVFEIFPIGRLVNDSCFDLSVQLRPTSKEDEKGSGPTNSSPTILLRPSQSCSWFVDVAPTASLTLLTSESPLHSEPLQLPTTTAETFVHLRDTSSSLPTSAPLAHGIAVRLSVKTHVCEALNSRVLSSATFNSPTSFADPTATVSFTCGTVLFNETPFSIEVFGRGLGTSISQSNKELLLAGLSSGKGLQPQRRHPLGYAHHFGAAQQSTDTSRGHSLRVRPVLPNVSASGIFTVGASAGLTAASASCIQSDDACGKESVHVFAISEKEQEVRIAPMWTIQNTSPHLTLRVLTGEGGIDIVVPPLCSQGLTTFPSKDSADPAIRFEFEGYSPSAPLHLASASQRSTTNSHQCLISPATNKSRESHSSTPTAAVATAASLTASSNLVVKPSCLQLTVDRRSRRQITVTAGVTDTGFPYAVENRTGAVMHVGQRGQARRVCVQPYSTIPFAFDTLTGEESKAISFETVHPTTGRTISHVVDPDVLPGASEGWELAKGLYMTARMSPQCCTFSLVTDKLLHASYVHRPRSISNITLFVSSATITLSSPVGDGGGALSASRTVFWELAEEGVFGMTASIDPAAFLRRREFELVTVRIEDLTFTVADNGRHRLVSASMGECEVTDVTWEGAKHRSVVRWSRASNGGGKFKNSSPHTPPSLGIKGRGTVGEGLPSGHCARLAIHEANAHNSTTATTTHIISLTAQFGPVRIALNDRFLHTLMSAGKLLSSQQTNAHSKQTSTAIQHVDMCSLTLAEDATDCSAAPARTSPPTGANSATKPNRLKIEKIFISPIPLNVTYLRRSDGKYDPFAGLPFRRLVTTLEGAPLTLSEVSAVDYVVTVPEDRSAWTEMALQLFVPVYRSSAVFQSYKLIGSLEILGNPVLFSSTVGEGLRDFMASTMALNPIEGMSHLLASTGSGLLHTCSLFSRVGGRLVGAATFDPNWLSECDARSGSSVLRGISQGASGVILGPLNGARNGGFSGALAGLLAGASGAIAKPVSGAFLSVASATEGAAIALRRNTVAGKRLESEGISPSSLFSSDEDSNSCSLPNNAVTAQTWVESGEGGAGTPSTSSTPTAAAGEGPLKGGGGGKFSPSSLAESFVRLGGRQAALQVSWRDFIDNAPPETFLSYGHYTRDLHLAVRALSSSSSASHTLSAQSALYSIDGSAKCDAAAIERAQHLRGTLGVGGMLKYVTLDQFVKCVGWEEAKKAMSCDEFRMKVAPTMMRELERALHTTKWL